MNTTSWNWVWNIGASKKIKFVIWLICHHSIPTQELLFHWNMIHNDICPRCNSDQETILHCLRDCRFTHSIWMKLGCNDLAFFSTNISCDWIKYALTALEVNSPLFLAGLWEREELTLIKKLSFIVLEIVVLLTLYGWSLVAMILASSQQTSLVIGLSMPWLLLKLTPLFSWLVYGKFGSSIINMFFIILPSHNIQSWLIFVL